MPAGTAAGAWVLVLALWGEPLPTPQTLPLAALLPTSPGPPFSPEIPSNLGTTYQSPSPTLSYTHQPHLCPSAPLPRCYYPGAAVGGQNITARIGEPLVLSCKGAPRKPPQQLEWKLVSSTPPLGHPTSGAIPEGPQDPTLPGQPFRRLLRFFSLQNTGRTEAWKVLSPQGGPWDSVARILPNGSLLLPAIGIGDEGTFRCRAINKLGKEVKSNYRVRVYRKGSRPWLSRFPFTPPLTDPSMYRPLIFHAWSVRTLQKKKNNRLLTEFPLQRFLGSQKLWILPLNSQLVCLIR